MTTSDWKPCLAGMHRDASFFDDILIEADRITSPRWDRVLPILEEEQVFMCRMMANALKSRPGARVLDFGTGSGVFAIQAARLGCRVEAIDLSSRALRFTRHNARLNKIPLTDQEPGPGEIRVRRCDGLTSYDLLGQFDFVILAPPYNPTSEGVKPALHASSGPLGQFCFETQLPAAARLLKPDGICIGNQMLVAADDGELRLPQVLRDSFPGAHLGFMRILPDDMRIVDFLYGQYRSFLKAGLNLEPDVQTVQQYIQGIEAQAPADRFALVYYELERRPGAAHDAPLGVEQVPAPTQVPQTWEDRIALHRLIVEHTSLEHSFPAPALFLDVDALPSVSIATDKDPWQQSVLRYAETWLAKNDVLEGESRLFDCLLVDTAPWYPTIEGRRALQQEAVAWVAGDRPKTAARLLAAYQSNTERLQQTQIGPFLHRQFTGQNDSSSWRGIQFTVHCERQGELIHGEHSDVVRKMVQQLNDCKVGEYSKQVKSPRGSLLNAAYAVSSLEALHVGLADLEAFDQVVRSRVDALRDSTTDESLGDPQLYAIDLDLCHQAMHHRIDQIAAESGLRQGAEDSASILIGIPVSMASHRLAEDQNGLPENYRGGIWIYAQTHGEWRPAMERYLRDLARLLALRYDSEYSELASRELQRTKVYEAEAAIFHHLPNDLAALDQSMRGVRDKVLEGKALAVADLPNLDLLAVMVMTADAATQRPGYQLLPVDLPALIEQQGLTQELIDKEFVPRVVAPYVDQRIALEIQQNRSEFRAYNVDQQRLLYDDFRGRYPFPRFVVINGPLRFTDARGAYVWLLLSLRAAAFHAFREQIARPNNTAAIDARVLISFDKTRNTIEVENTGRPPSPDGGDRGGQPGWDRDVQIFSRGKLGWRVRRDLKTAERFSTWDSNRRVWVTRIRYSAVE